MAGRRTGGLGKGLDALIPNKAGGPSKEPAKKTRSAVVKKDKPTEKDSPAAERLVKISSVEPNLNQPRRHFDEDALLELSESIKQYGVLQPLLVSDKKDYFEIIAGERRWRAAKMAGLKEVPVVVKEFTDQEIVEISLIENIQREDLNPFEQAQGLRDVIALWDCTQAEAAKRLGMAQPTLANKLRLLQLTTDQRQFVLDNGLTERHARAVLRLPENRRSEALITIAKRRMNARQTDLYIEQVLNAAAPGRHRISMVKDVRIFVNTIDHAIRLMTDNGVPATAHREERDGYIEYTVRIPTAAAQR